MTKATGIMRRVDGLGRIVLLSISILTVTACGGNGPDGHYKSFSLNWKNSIQGVDPLPLQPTLNSQGAFPVGLVLQDNSFYSPAQDIVLDPSNFSLAANIKNQSSKDLKIIKVQIIVGGTSFEDADPVPSHLAPGDSFAIKSDISTLSPVSEITIRVNGNQ